MSDEQVRGIDQVQKERTSIYTSANQASSAAINARMSVSADNNTVYDRGLVTARLYSLADAAADTVAIGGLQSDANVQIIFPCMPNVIELARQTNYSVTSALTIPDGIHIYKNTDPLIIPVSFQLSAYDSNYCKGDGPVALLRLAARLHALTLPASNENTATVAAADPSSSGNSDAQNKNKAAGSEISYDENSTVLAPVACVLDLISGGSNGPGIICVGYVKNVKVVLKEPWLTKDREYRNMPSAAEYSFDFVHAPSYTNVYKGGKGNNVDVNKYVSAMGPKVKKSLYNTKSLTSGVSRGGFSI